MNRIYIVTKLNKIIIAGALSVFTPGCAIYEGVRPFVQNQADQQCRKKFTGEQLDACLASRRAASEKIDELSK